MLPLKFDKNGLLPVVVQDYRTGEIRMFAWANKEAIEKTLQTGYAHYYSRSRGGLWKKGETSGNLQRVIEVRVDCDEDAVLYVVEQVGEACHTGERNCFFRDIEGERIKRVLPFETLQRLQDVIRQRIEEKRENSYTYRLYQEGEDRILQKFGEEAIESLIALKNSKLEEIRAELADMLYHMVLMLTVRGMDVSEVFEELGRRFKG